MEFRNSKVEVLEVAPIWIRPLGAVAGAPRELARPRSASLVTSRVRVLAALLPMIVLPAKVLASWLRTRRPAPPRVRPFPAAPSEIRPPIVRVLAVTVMEREVPAVMPPIVTAPAPRSRLCVPMKVTLRFMVNGLAVVTATAPALVLSIRTTSVAAPPPKFRVPVPRAVALLMLSRGELPTVPVAVESTTLPVMPELSPERVKEAPLAPDMVVCPL